MLNVTEHNQNYGVLLKNQLQLKRDVLKVMKGMTMSKHPYLLTKHPIYCHLRTFGSGFGFDLEAQA